MAKKKVKVVNIHLGKCSGCRLCEMACAAFHSSPKYSIVNPARSRIRVVKRELDNVFIPVIARGYAKAECSSRNVYVQSSTEYGECAFCGASCASRDIFKEPDFGLPLKCDMCEDDPPQEKPLCVRWCSNDTLTYEEREEEVEVEEEVKQEDVAIGLESMVDKYGLQKVIDTVARMAKKG